MNKVNKKSEAAIAYSGKVTVNLKRGSRILSTKQYHNQGLPALFRGLRDIFMGRDALDTTIPHSIALYSFDSEESANRCSSSTSWSDLCKEQLNNHLLRITPYIPLASSEVRDDVDEGTLGLQFKVDYSQITSGKKVYILALFPRKITEVSEDQSAIAVYKLTTADGTWDPQPIKISSTLLIDWQISFMNGES